MYPEEWYPKHMPTGSYFFKYKKKYGEFYDSYAAFSMDESKPRDELLLLLEEVKKKGKAAEATEEPAT